jgi:hypothetical protein
VNSHYDCGAEQHRGQLQLRVKELERQHLTAQQTISELEGIRDIDREIIAQLQLDGVRHRAKIANLEVALVTCRRLAPRSAS